MMLPTHLGAGSGPLPSLALHSLASNCLDVFLKQHDACLQQLCVKDLHVICNHSLHHK